MRSIALKRADVIVGVDTHKAEHVGFAIDGLGGDLGELQVLAVPSGYTELLAWADSFGPVHAFGVEGTGSYGSGLAKFLRRHGRKVIECSRPPRAGERRGNGKSDAIDAEHAARQVLAGKATTTPKLADGAIEALRLLKIGPLQQGHHPLPQALRRPRDLQPPPPGHHGAGGTARRLRLPLDNL